MKISYITNPGNFSLDNGFGRAGYGVVTSLKSLGHEVPYADPTAEVEIAFCQPDNSLWSNPDAYHIQYTPWESTELKEGWLECFNDEDTDEVWATSPWVAEVYRKAGVTKPIYVYEHGIHSLSTPRRRTRGRVLNFLHVGEPAPRKSGQLAMEAFREVFGDRNDVRLTIKAFGRSNIRVYDSGGSILGIPSQMYRNVRTIWDRLDNDAMNALYSQSDVLVYPSYGEGFGLIPLEAAVTGMPVICTDTWPPYEQFLVDELKVRTELVDSPWEGTHPGKMLAPVKDSLKAALTEVDKNFDWIAGAAFREAFKIRRAYNWDVQTERAFAHIFEKFDRN